MQQQQHNSPVPDVYRYQGSCSPGLIAGVSQEQIKEGQDLLKGLNLPEDQTSTMTLAHQSLFLEGFASTMHYNVFEKETIEVHNWGSFNEETSSLLNYRRDMKRGKNKLDPCLLSPPLEFHGRQPSSLKKTARFWCVRLNQFISWSREMILEKTNNEGYHLLIEWEPNDYKDSQMQGHYQTILQDTNAVFLVFIDKTKFQSAGCIIFGSKWVIEKLTFCLPGGQFSAQTSGSFSSHPRLHYKGN